MAGKERETMIRDRWQELQPGWKPRAHRGEFKKLCEMLEYDESVELLLSCDWRHNQVECRRGIAAATGRRVLLLKNGWFQKGVAAMPYDRIRGVESRYMTLEFAGISDTCAVAAFETEEGRSFADFVRARLLAPDDMVNRMLAGVLHDGEQVEAWWTVTSWGIEHPAYDLRRAEYTSSQVPVLKESGEERWGLATEEARPGIAAATGQRLFLMDSGGTDGMVQLPYHSIAMATGTGRGVRIAVATTRPGDSQVISIRFPHYRDDQVPFVARMEQNILAATPPPTEFKQARLDAQWHLLRPLWHEPPTWQDQKQPHAETRRLLGHFMEDGESIEAMLWARSGVVFATDRGVIIFHGRQAAVRAPYDSIVAATYAVEGRWQKVVVKGEGFFEIGKDIGRWLPGDVTITMQDGRKHVVALKYNEETMTDIVPYQDFDNIEGRPGRNLVEMFVNCVLSHLDAPTSGSSSRCSA